MYIIDVQNEKASKKIKTFNFFYSCLQSFSILKEG